MVSCWLGAVETKVRATVPFVQWNTERQSLISVVNHDINDDHDIIAPMMIKFDIMWCVVFAVRLYVGEVSVITTQVLRSNKSPRTTPFSHSMAWVGVIVQIIRQGGLPTVYILCSAMWCIRFLSQHCLSEIRTWINNHIIVHVVSNYSYDVD